jgi:hypothetical protein
VRQLEPFAGAGVDHRVLADHVAAAKGGEADRAFRARAGDAFARLDRALGEHPARTARGGLAEAESRAGRRIHLVPVMHLDDLDVVAGAELARGCLDQCEQHVDADAHVGREDHRNASSVLRERRLVLVGQAGRPDDGRSAVPCARRKVRESALRPSEVDQDVGSARRGVHVGTDENAARATEPLAGVASGGGTCRDVDRGGEHAVTIREDGLDQRLAHPARGAGDGNPYGGGHFLKMSRNFSHHERGSDQAPSPAVIAAADLLSSATEIGISSPSHRASLSSTK